MVVNVKTHNLSKCIEQVSVECSASNGGTSTIHQPEDSGTIIEEETRRLAQRSGKTKAVFMDRIGQ